MEFELEPEPPPAERRAIIAALERLLPVAAEPPAYRSRWRQAGIAESLAPAEGLGDRASADQSRRDAGVVEP